MKRNPVEDWARWLAADDGVPYAAHDLIDMTEYRHQAAEILRREDEQ